MQWPRAKLQDSGLPLCFPYAVQPCQDPATSLNLKPPLCAGYKEVSPWQSCEKVTHTEALRAMGLTLVRHRAAPAWGRVGHKGRGHTNGQHVFHPVFLGREDSKG